MCMEDVRLARETGSFQDVVSIGTTSAVLLQADDKRFAIVIGSPDSGTLTISFADTAVALNGIQIKTGDPPLRLSLVEHGNMVTRKITAIHSAATVVVGMWISRLVKT